ncbi:unnamed protein product [Adineta ricciae]|uniref:Uncharacterized protein n=1 Tax=Adineta ricciae TaxID=249248 RepID=A0A814AMN6_ADIRI|nr:unnamed protein product [Adineta ricciae]CAF1188499.1 unnamed protein product [Adineta ricciae]
MFYNQSSYSVGSQPYIVAVSNVNNDNWSDIIVFSYYSNNVEVRLNSKNGTFQNRTVHTIGTHSSFVVVADVDNNDSFDMIVTNCNSNNIGVLCKCGKRYILASDDIFDHCWVMSDRSRIHVRPDIVVTNSDSNNVGVLFNIDNDYLNNNNHLDIIVTNQNSKTISRKFLSQILVQILPVSC